MRGSKHISYVLNDLTEKDLDIVERINDIYQGFNRENNRFSITPQGMKINDLGGIIPYIESLKQEQIKKERKIKRDKYIKIASWFFGTLLLIIGLWFTYLTIPKEKEINQSKAIQDNKEKQKEKPNSELDSTLTTKPIQKTK